MPIALQCFRIITLLLFIGSIAACGSDGEKNEDDSLSALTLSSGALSPNFDSTLTDYAVSVDYDVVSLTVTATLTDDKAKLTVNNEDVVSAQASPDISLVVGKNTITVGVMAENGDESVYSIVVTRANNGLGSLSEDATLSNLTLSDGTLSPVFDSTVETYTATVGYSVSAIMVTSTTSNDYAQLKTNGIPRTSGQASGAIGLTVGDNDIDVEVTAENGDKKTYTITVTRESNGPVLSNDATLSNITVSGFTLSPAFSAAIMDYTSDVNVGTVSIYATATDDNAKITLDGTVLSANKTNVSVMILSGEKTISIEVLAENNVTRRTYNVQLKNIAHPTPNSFELVDPVPGKDHYFGDEVLILNNGNVVVTEPGHSGGFASRLGAIHLYDPLMQSVIASHYGPKPEDQFGSSGIVQLTNGNFVVLTPMADEDALVDAGSITLINGETGGIIGTPLQGLSGEQYGLKSEHVVALANDNFVVIAPSVDEAGITKAGKVMLVDGNTGALIGTPLVGDQAYDRLGYDGVTALNNGNYVINSRDDSHNSLAKAGSVTLVDGLTGAMIGTPLYGDVAFDSRRQESRDGNQIFALKNSNFVLLSPFDNADSVTDSGSFMLVNGASGKMIGSMTKGDQTNDLLNAQVIVSGNNFAVIAPFDDMGTTRANAGSSTLVNGANGSVINKVYGEDVDDRFGFSGATFLETGNFVVLSSLDKDGPNIDEGSATLMNGSTGKVIGTPLRGGDQDLFGNGGAVALPNGHYVVISTEASNGMVDKAGSITLVNGFNGSVIGDVIRGDKDRDQLGLDGVVALGNNNFVVLSSNDDHIENVSANIMATSDNAGSVMLVNGDDGQLIKTIYGQEDDNYGGDRFGSGGATVIGNSALIHSPSEYRTDSMGSLVMLDAVAGNKTEVAKGLDAQDLSKLNISVSDDESYYVYGAPNWNFNYINAGSAYLISLDDDSQ